MASVPTRIKLTEPGVAGSYELVQRREDGALLLRRPERELLSDVIRETEGQIFHDDEFVPRLERRAAAEDDRPAEPVP